MMTTRRRSSRASTDSLQDFGKESTTRCAASESDSSGDESDVQPYTTPSASTRASVRTPLASAATMANGSDAAVQETDMLLSTGAAAGTVKSDSEGQQQQGEVQQQQEGGDGAAAQSIFSNRTTRVLAAMVAIITVVAVVDLWTAHRRRDGSGVRVVMWYGWITAASTGLGVLPFVFLRQLKGWWIGVCNALAAGMMTAASIGLLFEGCMYSAEASLPAWVRAGLGAVLGVGFILATKWFLGKYDDEWALNGITGANASKMLLIMGVMTLHSLAEGVGIGVAFAGQTGSKFGIFISATLAIHNVPEGLAICLVVIPRGTPLLTAALWAVLSSLPQPIMAVPAYVSVQAFIPFLPAGLGFAAGAMLWVAIAELLVEALEKTDKRICCGTFAASAAVMFALQLVLR